MRAAARKIAAGLDEAARKREGRRGRTTYRAEVVRWNGPGDWRALLDGEDLDVDQDDVSLSKRVRQDHEDDPITVGDVLVLVEVADHEFVAIAVDDGGDDG